MSFGVFLSTEAAKFLKNIDKEDKYRVVEKLKLLENGPFSIPYKKSRAGKILIASGLEISGSYIQFVEMKLEC